MTKTTWEIGDKGFYAQSRRVHVSPSDREVTVTKVGRIWIEIDNGHRINKKTLEADGRGYTSPGRLWDSKEEHDAARLLIAMWNDFAGAVRSLYKPPAGITPDAINDMRRQCGLVVLEPASND